MRVNHLPRDCVSKSLYQEETPTPPRFCFSCGKVHQSQVDQHRHLGPSHWWGSPEQKVPAILWTPEVRKEGSGWGCEWKSTGTESEWGGECLQGFPLLPHKYRHLRKTSAQGIREKRPRNEGAWARKGNIVQKVWETGKHAFWTQLCSGSSDCLLTKGWCGQGSSPHDACQAKPLQRPLVRPENHHTWVFHQEPDSWRMSQGKVIELQAEQAPLSRGTIFIWKTELTNCGYWNWGIWQTFLKNEQSEPVTSRKTTEIICCQRQNVSCQRKIRNLKHWHSPRWAWPLHDNCRLLGMSSVVMLMIVGIMAWRASLKKGRLKSLPPGPQNVALFGNSIFTEILIIKFKWGHLVQ